MLKKKIIQNIILVFCSIVFAVYSIEAIIAVTYRVILREDLILSRIEQANKLGVPFDKRSKITVVDVLRSQGIDAYPVLFPASLIKENYERDLLPLGTISLKTIVLDNETGTFETFTSDEHGFHNPPGSWDAEEIDILLVGDSYAMGANVRSGADIRSQLSTYGKKVITLGMNGNGPLLELAGLSEYGKHLKPNIVLWLYYELNDLSDLETSKECRILREYLNDSFSQNLLHRQNEIDKEYIAFYEQVRKRKETSFEKLTRFLVRFITLNDSRGRLKLLTKPLESQLPLFETILEKAQNLTASWGGKLIFVYIPDYYRYSYEKDDRYAYRNQVLEIVKKLDIPIIDFHETIEQQTDPLLLFPFRVHGHFTEEGYALLAATIIGELQKNIYTERRGN
jgi:hypothetical protein